MYEGDEAGELRRQLEALRLDEAALEEAVKRRDFLSAHEIDQRIREAEAREAHARRAAAGGGGCGCADDAALDAVLREAAHRALGGGLTGAAAMGVQVCTLMWLRTTFYYQYRYGSSTREALAALYKQGGIRRFYQGLLPALFQGPLSRFGDTAANVGILSALDGCDATRGMPTGAKTLFSATAAAAWRVCLMPL
eukprot:1996369-Pleurochrysis_carterae.AAC.1